MSENAEKNIQVDPGFELPQNASVLSSSEQDGYRLYKDPEMQFIISQLASLIAPIASVSKVERNGSLNFISNDVKDHPNAYNENFVDTTIEDISNCMVIYSIFHDGDHRRGKNIKGGVFYDFNLGNLDESRTIRGLNEFGLSADIQEKVSEKMREKLLYFKSHIQGESGLSFLESLLVKAGPAPEIPVDAIKLQTTLLDRCDYALNNLK